MSSIKIDVFGAYLTSWKIDNREVLYQGSEIKRTGIPFLFPNFDAGTPLPNHGFGRLSKWNIIESSKNSCHLRLSDTDISPEFRQMYPYQFIADLKIKAEANHLDYYFEVLNKSEVDLPLSPGLHPYWPVKHNQKSKLKIKNFPNFNPNNVDWDKNPPNSNYQLPNIFEVEFPEYTLEIKEIVEDYRNFRHLQIWSQNTSFPDYDYICFEPVVRPANGINTDPILVSPNKTEKFHLQFTVTFR